MRRTATMMLILTTLLPLKAENRQDYIKINAFSDNVLHRLLSNYTVFEALSKNVWQNPAFLPLKYPASLCHAGIGYFNDTFNKSLIAGKGMGEKGFDISGDAYMHSGNSTLTGNASYTNGKTLNPQWNESGEYDKIYPFMIADSVGGDLDFEHYAFAGSYSHEGEKLYWGAGGSYAATLSSRKIDPRPRNVAGDLNISAGIALKCFSNYIAGMSGTYERFRLSTDIKFVNETGETKLFHLTGLGMHYTRFDGAGKSVTDDSHAVRYSLNILPRNLKGWFANAYVRMLCGRHVVEDINKLPLGRISEKGVNAEGGYLNIVNKSIFNFRYGISGEWNYSYRTSTENIFGDASSSSYPIIGSLTLFFIREQVAALKGVGNISTKSFTAGIYPTVGWARRRMVYVTPRRDWLNEEIHLSIQARGAFLLTEKTCISVSLGWKEKIHVNSHLMLLDSDCQPENIALDNITRSDFEAASSSGRTLNAKAEFNYATSRKVAVCLNIEYANLKFSSGHRGNMFQAGVGAIF